MSQEKLLSNDYSNNRLFYRLTEKLCEACFLCKHAYEDADALIVHTAISVAIVA